VISVSYAPLITERLELRPLAWADAETFWPLLADEALYRWIARAPPASPGDVEARFARISERTAEGRADQWINWTAWRRKDGAAIGLVETTVRPTGDAALAYLFGSAFWGQGYAYEATSTAIAALRDGGVVTIEAPMDTRNAASRAHSAKLGFLQVETRPSDDIIAGAPSVEELWRLG
jgi:RimJ/RimL family protein N-acetyltransferase